MKVTMIKEDAVVLVFHLDIMKKSVSDGFRRTHGLIKGRKMLNAYKETLKTIENYLIDDHDSDNVVLDIELDTEKFEILLEFLKFYINELEKGAAAEGMEVNNHPGLKPLQNILYTLLIAEQDPTFVS